MPDECFEVTEDGVITDYYCAEENTPLGFLSLSNEDYEMLLLTTSAENLTFPIIPNVRILNKIVLDTG